MTQPEKLYQTLARGGLSELVHAGGPIDSRPLIRTVDSRCKGLLDKDLSPARESKQC